MTGELIINTLDAWDTWGVSMADGFIAALETPAAMKDFQKNTSRAEHGSRYVVASPYLAEREVTLGFVIIGSDTDDYKTKKDAFMEVLQTSKVNVQTSASSEIYRLIYTGKSASYSLSVSRCVGTLKVKFVEPDPSNRGTTSKH